MKLHDRVPPGAETLPTQDVRKLNYTSTGRSAATAGAAASGEHVEFSGNLGRLARALSNYDSSRANRVEALRVQYQSGNFRPDSAATSRSMVSRAILAGTESDAGGNRGLATGSRTGSNPTEPAKS